MDSTTARKLDNGDRILIAEQYTEAAGGGGGELRAARKIVKTGALRVPGEPVGVHAATVIRVERSCALGRLDVVTNLGTVEAVTPGQRFRLAPKDMRDSADIRADMAAAREQQETREAYDRANPRDVDGVNVHPGDLVEAIAVGGVRAGQPGTIARAIGVYGIVGGLLVPRPYERAYGEHPAGTGMMLTFRRLADQTVTDGTARRSCGCPAPIRETLIPAPQDDDSAAWDAAHRERNRMSAEDWTHRPACPWAIGERGTTAHAARFIDDATDDGEPLLVVHSMVTCGHSVQYQGRTVDVNNIDPDTLLWHRYPPATFPDRTALPAVRVAACLTAAWHDMTATAAAAELLSTTPRTEAERLLAGGGSSYGLQQVPAVEPTADPWATVFANPDQ